MNAPEPPHNSLARIDHLAVVAASLEEGVAWCEATLGVTPGPGGEHPLMGTHNRLFRIATVNFPRAYFEIIAINPEAPHTVPARAHRWFDMDDAEVQARIKKDGPRLLHFIANVPDIRAASSALEARGIDRGTVLDISRMTPRGILQWQMTVRPDGQRLFNGTLPTLIQWIEANTAMGHCAHPANAMPDSGVTLQALTVTHPEADALAAAYQAIGLVDVTVKKGAANLAATLRTPRGTVVIESKGI